MKGPLVLTPSWSWCEFPGCRWKGGRSPHETTRSICCELLRRPRLHAQDEIGVDFAWSLGLWLATPGAHFTISSFFIQQLCAAASDEPVTLEVPRVDYQQPDSRKRRFNWPERPWRCRYSELESGPRPLTRTQLNKKTLLEQNWLLRPKGTSSEH